VFIFTIDFHHPLKHALKTKSFAQSRSKNAALKAQGHSLVFFLLSFSSTLRASPLARRAAGFVAEVLALQEQVDLTKVGPRVGRSLPALAH